MLATEPIHRFGKKKQVAVAVSYDSCLSHEKTPGFLHVGTPKIPALEVPRDL